MNLPDKIYINNEQTQKNNVCRYWEYATEKRLKDDDVEYTDIAKKWHLNIEVPRSDKGKVLLKQVGQEPILIDMNDWMDKHEIEGQYDKQWQEYANENCVVFWAYLADFTPW